MSSQLCTYCGELPTTRDHVPPRAFFCKPRPDNPAVVPCCLKCNNSFAIDDEYAALWIAGHAGSGLDPRAYDILEKMFRSLERPQARGFRRSVAGVLESGELCKDPFTGEDAIEVSVDVPRIARVIARTAIGLHLRHYKERLVPEWGAFATPLEGLTLIPEDHELKDYLETSILEITRTCVPMHWAESTVQLVFGRGKDDSKCSAWKFTFYGGCEWCAWTFPRELLNGIDCAFLSAK